MLRRCGLLLNRTFSMSVEKYQSTIIVVLGFENDLQQNDL